MNPFILKVLNWLKPNWLIFVVLIVVILGVWQYQVQKNLLDNLAQTNEAEFTRHTEDLTQIRTAFETEQSHQEAINQAYNTELERLTVDYNQRIRDLEVRTRTRRQAFISETSGNPDEMSRRLQERLHWGTPAEAVQP